jgi:predicted ATPase
MLISICGGQGSGKSTVLSELAKEGFNIIQRKTSRSILTDWNVTLDEINDDLDLTIKFQEEIIKRKYEDELFAIKSNDIYFTERTYADLMTYFLLSFGNNNNVSTQLMGYYNDCIQRQHNYSHVFYLKSGFFVPEHDGVRGSNVLYSRVADLTMLDLTQQMTAPGRLTVIETPCITQRLNIIKAHSGLFN